MNLFKRKLFTASIASVLAFGTLQHATAQDSSTAETPAALYKTNCAICHGDDGKGSAIGLRLHAKDLSSDEVQSAKPEEMTQTIKSGKNNMPAFASKLDDSKIAQLVQFIRDKKFK